MFEWLLSIGYVCFVLNHAHNATIKNIPLNDATGCTCDMSPLLRFHFWDPIFFNTEDSTFPSDIPEKRVRLVGISENFGHDVIFKIFNSSANKIINRSNVRQARDKESHNLRADRVNSPEVITLLRREISEDKDATSENS